MKISLITVVRNGAATLDVCLQSIQRQTYPTEHIVVDGASTDETSDILQEYKLNCGCKVISEPDKGIYDGMNKGIRHASGDIIGTLNADDYYPSNQVISRIAQVFRDETIESCYGNLIYVDALETGTIRRTWRSGPFHIRNFYVGWMPPHPTFFVRRSAYEKFGEFNLSLGSAADYELMLRFLVKYKISCTYLPEVLVHMRTGGVSNSSIKNRIKANMMDRKAWEVNGLKPYPWTLWLKPLRKIPQFFGGLSI